MNRLPIACPACNQYVFPLGRCWVDTHRPGLSVHQCEQRVDEDDMLGLCEQHRNELAGRA
jgi:hypothetical protein